MKRHRRASALYVSKLLVRTALANFGETERDKNGNDLAWFENRDVPHRLRNRYVLDTDELGLQVWFSIFEKHGDDFLKVVVKLVESFPLRVGAGETRDKPDKHLGLGAAFDDGRIDSHD
jgi:hypothetical protein